MHLETAQAVHYRESIMKAIKFNTGRQYTAEGQTIVAYQVGEPAKDEISGLDILTVRFLDLSRMVSGEITVTELTEKAVMEIYDLSIYRNVWINDQEKAQALAAVA